MENLEDLVDDLVPDHIEEQVRVISSSVLKKLDKVAEVTGVSSETIMHIILVLCLVYVLVGFFKEAISVIVGTVYPMFKSLEAIEANDSLWMKIWLCYWVIFSLFCIADRIADNVCLKRIVPFYFFIKLAFLVYL